MSTDMEVLSIRDRDLRTVLGQYNKEVAIDAGEETCRSCSRKITWENLGAILVDQGSLILFCDFSECLDIASNRS